MARNRNKPHLTDPDLLALMRLVSRETQEFSCKRSRALLLRSQLYEIRTEQSILNPTQRYPFSVRITPPKGRGDEIVKMTIGPDAQPFKDGLPKELLSKLKDERARIESENQPTIAPTLTQLEEPASPLASLLPKIFPD